MRHPDKGCWEGSRKLDTLGLHIDTEEMRVYMTEKKVKTLCALSKKIFLLAQSNRRLVSLDLFRQFCAHCVPLTLALPSPAFTTGLCTSTWHWRSARSESQGRVAEVDRVSAGAAGATRRKWAYSRAGAPNDQGEIASAAPPRHPLLACSDAWRGKRPRWSRI